MLPLVTIGVCVHNGEKLLGNAIESILEQDFPPEQVQTIFVDDGSSDSTPQIISSFIHRFGHRAKVIRTDWHGIGSARQTVVENALGTYVIWVDCDMILSRDFVRRQVEFMNANPTVGIAKGVYGINEKENLVAALENMDFIVDLPGEVKAMSKAVGTGGCIYRLTAVKSAGGFDSSIQHSGEDQDAEYRIRRLGWKLYITKAVFYEKRRESWQALWHEYFWRGCNWYVLSKRNTKMVNISKLLPPVAILLELKKIPLVYSLTHRKRAFLLPLHYVYKRIAWFMGFIRSGGAS